MPRKKKTELDIASKNRRMKCNFSGKEIIVNPERWLKFVTFYGSEAAAEKNFISKEAEVLRKERPVYYAVVSSPDFKRWQERVVETVKVFHKSDKSPPKLAELDSSMKTLAGEYNIPFFDYVILPQERRVHSIIFKVSFCEETFTIDIPA